MNRLADHVRGHALQVVAQRPVEFQEFRPQNRVGEPARQLGESVDWLLDVADEMDTEDGVIWVYGDTDDGIMAFTNFGIETLTVSDSAPTHCDAG